jgi:uncharacterized protein Yka (UPF0111/DUF47 family)
MGFSFLPKTTKFDEMFLELIGKTAAAAAVLADMCSQPSGFREKIIQIMDLENEGANLSQDISRQLAATFITPIDREDIHDLNKAMLKVLTLIKQISLRIGEYSQIEIPGAARKLTVYLSEMVGQAAKMLAKLGKKDRALESHLDAIEEAKRESDMVLMEALTRMYAPRELDSQELLTIIRWSRIYDRLERAINRTDTLAELVEGVFVKNA